MLLDEHGLLIVGGKYGADEAGEIAATDLGEQTRRAFRNVLAVLAHVARTGATSSS